MLKPIIRSTTFLANWVAWVIRQPGMLLTMVIGPFIILGLFAMSNAAESQRANVIILRPADEAQGAQIPTETLQTYFNVVAETKDANWAREQLVQRRVRGILVLPAQAQETLSEGQQARITVQTNEIDPISLAFLRAEMSSQVADLNNEVLRRGVESAKGNAAETNQRLDSSVGKLDRVDQDANNPEAVRADVGDLDAELAPTLDGVPALSATARLGSSVLPSDQAEEVGGEISQAEQTALAARATLEALKVEADATQPNPDRIRQLSTTLRGQLTDLKTRISAIQSIPTATVVQPFAGALEQIAAYKPTLVTFYAPAALALLLQHFSVTLAALSMVRARLLGMVEFWRIAPIHGSEIIAGNYLSYGILSMIAWGLLTAALVYLLGVPILGSIYYLLGTAALLILASLGLGFIISLFASNEQQAAQLAMLVLLGSVFLSGFVRPLETIEYPVRYASFLLPATFGIQLFQDIMLRGLTGQDWQYIALGVLSVLGLVFTLVLFRRELSPS